MNEPHLFFDFANQYGVNQPMLFTHPHHIIKANVLDEVQSAFAQVEAALAEGFYVAGCVSYEAAPAFDEALEVKPKGDWPLIWFGVFTEPELQFETSAVPSEEFSVSSWKMDATFDEYQGGIEKIKAAIERGDTYQVNYTTRLETAFEGDAFSFYKQLAGNQQSSYSAYLSLDDQRKILSASPELFFRKNGEHLVTKPMKGTAKRGRTLEEDEVSRRELSGSSKEQSENLMIVDLLRNDVGRLAVTGTVQTPKLFDIETYPTLHQMTSTVEGKLPKGTSMYQIFQALFPCGSITGAPKVSTMEYIASLESSPRDIYCGAIGYMTPHQEAVFNVPIRTVLLNQGKAVYGAGGGITWDSTTEGEYEELHTKARLLTEERPSFKLLETMKLSDGKYSLLNCHLNRIGQSARYFNYSFDEKHASAKLQQLARSHPQGLYKVRMLNDQWGDVELETDALNVSPEEVYCTVAHRPVDHTDPFLFHKTTHRRIYEQHQNNASDGSFAVLLWNERGELTEFTTANLVVKHKGEYSTPPISSGLLAGTLREELIARGQVKEQILYKDDLASFEEVWMVNGLRGWIKARVEEDK